MREGEALSEGGAAGDTAPTMSDENVELVRRLLGMFARREHEQVFEFYSPDIEWIAEDNPRPEGGTSAIVGDLAGTYHGHDGVRTYWRRWLEAWRDLEFEVEDVVGAGDEVVALIRDQRQWGRHSGIVVEMAPYALVFTVRDGLVVRWRAFAERDAAFAAVGIDR